MNSAPHPEPCGLHRFAVFTAGATLALIGVGGLVTSHGAGMAVPDWPNTYGYNMFFFPVSSWIGGILYEHSHRLVASAVGLLTLILAAWLHGKAAQPVLRWGGATLLVGGLAAVAAAPQRWQDAVVLGVTGAAALGASFVWPKGDAQPRWLRRLGLLAVGLVILQGVLGGLRVTLFKDELGIVHATLAQFFFVLISALALFTSRGWRKLGVHAVAATRPPDAAAELLPRPSGWGEGRGEGHGPLHTFSFGRVYLSVTLLVLIQLILGASMRHQHAGLAVPDFPLAYGRLWPATDADSVAGYNRARLETRALNDITPAQIHLHMAHRGLAVAVAMAIGACWWLTRRRLPRGHPLRRLAAGWFALVIMQFGLGAWTVWSNKAADITTLHVVTGALTLLTGSVLTLMAFRYLPTAPAAVAEPVMAEHCRPSPLA